MAIDVQPRTLTPAARAILDSAARLFYAEGINSVGVDTIAADAGVTKKTLYDQFGSKAAVVVAYLTERDERFREWVDASIAKESSADAKVLAVFDALSSWMNANSFRGCAFVHAHSELIGDPDHPAHAVIRSEKVWLRELFEELVGARPSPDAPSLAVQLVTLIEGASIMRSISDVSDAIPDARAAAATLLRNR
ncbi:TetR/AcrR family transcriptional regulator [Gordonia hydrophobica]|uniref:TetR/AcrR family transcriptional regulator n=1 Tax=Gordonia hydrophobica TaxID=40516 RepID=A0ABZ2U5Q4_9ACTN|nr:TetR/AcrR family transcriptional regulator [Gordonia hydrophobica]MBM7365660.1 AcrR family transcriptional regulator [Gordonia hydrophobica]